MPLNAKTKRRLSTVTTCVFYFRIVSAFPQFSEINYAFV
jgi:hypothetical protein